ncbi:hypothetical protein [Dongia sp.]|uniref:hypothetical protein n=1 Tax=Dongia sp. TaxID=1977262 RepID=UPI003751BF1B
MSELYLERRQGWHRCRPLPAEFWAIGREHAGPSALITSHNELFYVLDPGGAIVRLRLGALRWKRTFQLVFKASEAELRLMFRNARYPAIRWLEAAQNQLIVSSSEAGLIDGAEFGFTAGGAGVEQRPIACRVLRALEGGHA